MGTYTTLAVLAKAPRYRRHAQGGDVSPLDDDRQAADAYTHVCPQCGDGATFEADCPRCDVPMRSAQRSAAFPKRANEVADGTIRSIEAAAFGLCVVFGAPAFLLFATASIDRALAPVQFPYWDMAITASALIASLAIVVTAIVAGTNRIPAIRERLRWGRVLRAARARLRSLTATDPRSVPACAQTPVRVRGGVRVEDGVVHVADGEGRVRVPVDARVRVIDGDRETYHLEDGQDVEVVGVGARPLGTGEAYRDTRGEFVFDAGQPIEVWIR